MIRKLTITLKSDLCAGSGESMGSLIDTDICYDNYGLPYIPSKRIKGLLKEAFIEYSNWTKTDENKDELEKLEKELFGIEGDTSACDLKIDNAYLQNINGIQDNIKNVEKRYKKYLTKQRIINTNTYVRHQTAIDNETGVAKVNSLRSTRVLNKGAFFEAEFECKTEQELEILQKCVKLVTHMGTNRTRGYGEVLCKITSTEVKEHKIVEYDFDNEKTYKIDILLKAESSIMVSKQNSENSESYIPGSNIMGAIASKYIEKNIIPNFINISEEYKDLFLNGKVKYSNAYITEKDGSVEYFPSPLSFSKVKNTSNKYHNKMFDVNEDNIQLSNLDDKYVSLDDNNYIKDVKMTEHYHHQRAKELSIGHVSSQENGGTLYQFTSIDREQYFLSHIELNGKYANKILNYLKVNDSLRVGKSKTAEYGKLIIKNIKINEIKENYKTYKKFAAILTSPVILFDEEKVKVANDRKTLINALKNLFRAEELEITKSFIGYSEESGYNAIWNLPKEQLASYEKGTTICFTSKNGVDLKEEYCIGLRTNEGYGKIKIYNISENDSSNIELKKYENKNENQVKYKDLQKETRKLIKRSIKQVVKEEIRIDVLKKIQNNNIVLNNTTIGRILLMLQESDSLDTFMTNVSAIKDVKKLQTVLNIIKNKEELNNISAYIDYKSVFLNGQKITDEEINEFTLEYIKQLFTILKIKGGENND